MKSARNIFLSEWFLGLLTMLAVLGAYYFSWGPLVALENRSYDMRARMLAAEPVAPIAIVAIDEKSIQDIGRWPWSRDQVAGMIDIMTAYDASVIGLDVFFSEAKVDEGQLAISGILERVLGMKGFGRSRELGEVAGMLEEALMGLDKDAMLEESLEGSGKVVVPIDFLLGQRVSGETPDLPPFVLNSTLPAQDPPETLTAMMVQVETLPEFAARASGVGHVTMRNDSDGAWRKSPVMLEYGGRYFPSFALDVALKHLNYGISRGQMADGGIRFGKVFIPTGGKKEMFIKYRGDMYSYPHYSFSDVLMGDVPASNFADKIVLVGVVAEGLTSFGVTPLARKLSPVELQATIIDNIISQDFIRRPPWADKAEMGALVLMGLMLSFAIPRLRALWSALITVVLVAGWVGAGMYLFKANGWWLMIMPHTVLMVAGYMAVVSMRFMVTEKRSEKFESANIETNKMLGLSFQSQGMLDLALDKFMKCPLEEDEEIRDHLYNLALDFERKRQFNKAVSIYEHIRTAGEYKDIDEKIEKLTRAGETMIFGGSQLGGGKKDATMIVEGTDMAPTLGRYEVKKELGKGAMGIVYLGLDPKINRQVAIKTIRFDEVDEAMIKEVKERFFREAEAAGRLSHPNIVTIFDAGEDQDLAYVAMELLDGKDLSDIVQEKGKFPPLMAIQIVGQVADALNYAHRQGIVHRDIKPANIMMLKKGGVKVTDFGIARVVESSKTQTGVVLGTPSYMSPEQVAGKKVDGRSDLFSLGVMFYELLSGKKPFTGDSLATLMYNIANNPHVVLKQVAPDVPNCCAVIVDRFLAKDLGKRYQSGGQAIKDLKACYQNINKGAP